MALAAAAAPAAMLAWSRAALAGAGGAGRARLAWASAWTLAGVAGLVALGWSRAQGLPGLLGSRAGHLALASSAALALALAAAWLWRREADTDSHDGKPARRGAVLAAGALALLALLLGQGFAWQGGESLAVAHWPFAWRYDADLPVSPHTWRRLAWAGAQMASAVLLALAAWRWRRWRIALSLAAIALGASVSWPHPRMLLTEARATSYQHSPLPFSDRELLRGAALYQAHCASCHGAGADGRGVRAASLPRWPSVLGPALFDNRLEGELHWRVAHGGDAPQDARPCRPLARR